MGRRVFYKEEVAGEVVVHHQISHRSLFQLLRE